MPLKAIVEGETVIGPDLSDEEWATLKERHRQGLPITMACCGAPGHLRVSKQGTRHFYHAVDAGCHYEEESREHLEIKYRVYRACKDAGWETCVEYPSPDRDWIADVYATRDGRKVVFEIQISNISPDDLEERDRKYRSCGIESYWLLDHFLGRSKDFASWYDSDLSEVDDRLGEKIPYIDPTLFVTGPENHIFIPKGIRTVGLDAKKQALFTTNNPAISLPVWVREVLNGNYRHYLEETAAAYRRNLRLRAMAGPALLRFRDFYRTIIRDRTCREKAGHLERIFKTDPVLKNDPVLQKRFRELYVEINWLENEYRSYMAESSGLFVWKTISEPDTPRPFFRLGSEPDVKKLQACVKTLEQWEESFTMALGRLEQELSLRKKSGKRNG